MTRKANKGYPMKKAISAFIATAIIVAFTISAAVMVTSFLTGVIKFQTASVSSQAVCAQKCSILIDKHKTHNMENTI